MNYTLVSICLCGLAAGCVLVITGHPWFAGFVFFVTFILSGMINSAQRQTAKVIENSKASASVSSQNPLIINRPDGIM